MQIHASSDYGNDGKKQVVQKAMWPPASSSAKSFPERPTVELRTKLYCLSFSLLERFFFFAVLSAASSNSCWLGKAV